MMNNLTIGKNTSEIIFVRKPNEKYYEEVFNKGHMLLQVFSRSSRSQVFFKVDVFKNSQISKENTRAGVSF